MIRRRTSEAGGGVLSFTFLDVLTCTMGSLVLLLVVLAQKATDVTLEEALANANKPKSEANQRQLESNATVPSAGVESGDATPEETTTEASADNAAAEELSKVVDGLTSEELAKRTAEVREHAAKVAQLRAEAAQRLEEERARVSQLEEHERRLEQEIAKLRLALEQLDEAEKKKNVDQEAAKEELERLKALVAETQKQIEQLRKETTGKKSYAIVPYKGASGTTRRPIYIECTADAVTIQPEGIRLTVEDFDGPLRSGNPLNATIRAAREELNARAVAAGQTDMPDPYPLLIVRPNGADAFSVSENAIMSWDADHGYEFVEEDKKLEYPDSDPRLEQVMRHAVEQARQRQALLAKAAPRRYGSRLVTSHGEAEDVETNGADGGFTSITNSGGNGDRIGDHSNENWMQSVGGLNGQSGTGRGAAEGQTPANRYASAVMTDIPVGAQGGAGSGAIGPSSTPAAETQPTEDAPTDPATREATQLADAAGAGTGHASQTETLPTEGIEGVHDADATGRSGGSTFAGSKTPTGVAASQTTAPPPSAGADASAANAPSSAAAGAEGTSVMGGNANLGGNAIEGKSSTASAAKSRGANWANDAAKRRSSPISRPIRVVVSPEQLAVMPTNQGGSGPVGDPTSISFNQSTDKVLDQLAATVKDRMSEWGLAGHNMYWRPTLILQVSPGAEQHAIRLNDLLRDSGIDVKFQEVASRTEEGAGSGTTR